MSSISSVRESYCGLCEQCQLDSPDFQEAVSKVKTYLDQLPGHWQRQCINNAQDFPLLEFRRGLDWFSDRIDCPGCKDLGGTEHCGIRDYAKERQQDFCYECLDHDSCRHLIFV
ncbi:MAG: DUF3795 domain-containing protein [Desulfobaccales bacterium]